MGQKCPCMAKNTTEENTFYSEIKADKSLQNKKYDKLLKSKKKNSKTNYQDEMTETYLLNNFPKKQIGVIQRHLKMYYFKIKVKQALIDHTEKIYEELMLKYTNSNLDKVEKNIVDYQIKPNNDTMAESSFLLKTKILISRDEKSFYSGQLKVNLQKHGKGFLLNDEGSKFEGIWRDDKIVFGRYIDREGNLFEGHFKDFKINGPGFLKTFSGTTYIGNFIDNQKSGKGKEDNFEYIYEGDYKDNQKNGHGSQSFKMLGDYYIGDYLNEKINGNGVYSFKNGEKYSGPFKDGMMHGIGKYTWPDGSEYIGDYVNNIKNGYGLFKMNCGKIYDGPFENGRPNGKGKLTNGQGKCYRVLFIDGKLQKKKEVVPKNKGAINV